MKDNGFHISIEGIDHTGKSTICKMLKSVLVADGLNVRVVSDPPSISPWVNLKLDITREERITKISEAIFFLSSRLDNYEKCIQPFLNEGGSVISDRYIDSWFAYQSYRLQSYFGGVNKALSFLVDLNEFFCNKNLLKMPDMTILLDADPSITIGRIDSEKVISKYDTPEIQYTVRNIYLKLAKLYDFRFRIINTNNKKIIEIVNEILFIIKS